MSSPDVHGTTSDGSADPWLLVVGMHRSGTSAITGALGALGFNTPHARDRTGFKPESNSEHWESLSLSAYNEHLLAEMGGSWEAPPDLSSMPQVDEAFFQLDPPLPILNAAYPEPGPRVWKDPRLCLLLPLWRPVLPSPIVAVLDLAIAIGRRSLPTKARRATPRRRNRIMGALQPRSIRRISSA